MSEKPVSSQDVSDYDVYVSLTQELNLRWLREFADVKIRPAFKTKVQNKLSGHDSLRIDLMPEQPGGYYELYSAVKLAVSQKDKVVELVWGGDLSCVFTEFLGLSMAWIRQAEDLDCLKKCLATVDVFKTLQSVSFINGLRSKRVEDWQEVIESALTGPSDDSGHIDELIGFFIQAYRAVEKKNQNGRELIDHWLNGHDVKIVLIFRSALDSDLGSLGKKPREKKDINWSDISGLYKKFKGQALSKVSQKRTAEISEDSIKVCLDWIGSFLDDTPKNKNVYLSLWGDDTLRSRVVSALQDTLIFVLSRGMKTEELKSVCDNARVWVWLELVSMISYMEWLNNQALLQLKDVNICLSKTRTSYLSKCHFETYNRRILTLDDASMFLIANRSAFHHPTQLSVCLLDKRNLFCSDPMAGKPGNHRA